MTVYYATEVMGSGKTLTSSILALTFNKEFPKGKIRANQHLFASSADKRKYLELKHEHLHELGYVDWTEVDKKVHYLPNFIYSPALVFPISELELSDGNFIIVDDCVSINNFDLFTKIISSYSRKLDVQFIITGQYYTDVSKKFREISTYKYKPNLIVEQDLLEIKFTERIDDKLFINHYRTIERVSDFYDLYDTNEVVPPVVESALKNEIKRNVRTYTDLEMILKLYYGNRSEYKTVKTELAQELGFEKKRNGSKNGRR